MSNNNFVKGMAIGAATGTAIGMMIAPKRKKHKSLAGKALKTAGSIVDSVSSMIAR